jgi:hypothetical protein
MEKKKRTNLKKIAFNLLKITWGIIGIFIIFWTSFWYIKMKTINTLGVIALAVLFASGIYMLMFYMGLTILFFIIYLLIKKLKKKNGRRKNNQSR